MKIAELKGEKTVKALAKRLLAQSSTSSDKEMEAALLHLNPHLNQIGGLERERPSWFRKSLPLPPMNRSGRCAVWLKNYCAKVKTC